MLAKSKTSLSLSRSFSIHQHSKKAIFVKSPTTIVLGHHSRGHYWRYEANKGGKCQKPILFFQHVPSHHHPPFIRLLKTRQVIKCVQRSTVAHPLATGLDSITLFHEKMREIENEGNRYGQCVWMGDLFCAYFVL